MGVEAQTALRRVGTVHPVAVELPRRDIGEIAVPDVLGALGQRDASGLAAAVAVEQAQLDLLGIGGKQRKVGTAPIPRRAQRVRTADRAARASPLEPGKSPREEG